MLGAQAMGPPDQEKIGEFAQWIGPRLGPVVSFLVAVLAAWLAARVPTRRFEHGIAVGICGAVIALTLGVIGGAGVGDLVSFLLYLAAGAVGGWLASR